MGAVELMELVVFCTEVLYDNKPSLIITTYASQDGTYAIRWTQHEHNGFRPQRSWRRRDIRALDPLDILI